ncbi:hypothetical protein, partial [Acidiphilium sp. 34-64-41]|uniref:hypothetical protein n=2 Tax=unclassified Acidiphilium TaxID=2617493 RepID=UPI000BD5AAA5
IAIDCAATSGTDPSTLVRAARDFQDKEPKFAAAVALFALSSLLAGGGYDPAPTDAAEAVKYLWAAALKIGALGWAEEELDKQMGRQCAVGREMFQSVARAAVDHLRRSKGTQ